MHRMGAFLLISLYPMARIMAIDFGSKRMGIAVTDPLCIIATPLTTLHPKDAIAFFTTYFQQEEVECVVFGKPMQNDGSDSESMPALKAFMGNFKKAFPGMKVDMMDERFTTKTAKETMFEAGLGKMKRRDKGLTDRTSAVIILQSYMMKMGL